MPNWFKVFLLVFLLICWLIIESVSIPFVYQNEYFFVTGLMYFFLAGALFLGVILSDGSNRTLFRNAQKKDLKQKIVICFSAYLLGPFLFGFCFSRLAPLIADIYAVKTEVFEYHYLRAEPYAKTFRQLSKLYVMDIKGNEDSFIVKNDLLDRLRLQTNDKLIARGRSCILGLVVDEINDIPRAD